MQERDVRGGAPSADGGRRRSGGQSCPCWAIRAVRDPQPLAGRTLEVKLGTVLMMKAMNEIVRARTQLGVVLALAASWYLRARQSLYWRATQVAWVHSLPLLRS